MPVYQKKSGNLGTKPWEKPIMINLIYWLNKIILNVIKLVNITSKENY